jgi:hypothetical protein
MAERRIAEVHLYVSSAEGEEDEYRADVLGGATVGPEDASLQREEFTGSSVEEAVEPALTWAKQMVRRVAD